MTKYLLCCSIFFSSLCCGQKLPIIKANSTVVSILDGDNLQKGNWQISPQVNPDVYNAGRSKRPKKIVFYTDIDSISFVVEPQKQYNFIILLNGKDTAHTTISTIPPAPISIKNKNTAQNTDTIPFRLGKGNKLYINGKINNSAVLEFMFDTGSDQEVISKRGLAKGVKMNFTGKKTSISIGGAASVNNSNKNKLQIGNTVWENIPFIQIDNADADGIIGYNVFDNKIVEIDYNKKILVIHNHAFRIAEDYQKLPMEFKGSLPFIETTLTTGSNHINAYFEFDLGSNGSLWINSGFAEENALHNTIETTGKSQTTGFDGHRIYNETVVFPKLSFGKYDLFNVPADVELPSENNNFKWGILGTDILRRYNTILDFQNDYIYLKPNGLLNEPYSSPFNKSIILTAIASLILAGAIIFYTFRKLKKGKKNTAKPR